MDSKVQTSPTPPRDGWWAVIRNKVMQIPKRRWADIVFIVVFLLLMIVTSLLTDIFFTQRNLTNLMRQTVTNGLLSLGMLIVILTGGIDLSVGPIVALTGIMAAGLSNQGLPLGLAMGLSVLVGVFVGAVNGFFISRYKLQPFIVTLATLGAIRGLVYVYSDIPITPDNPAFRDVLGAGFVGPIPVSALIMFAFYPIVWFFVNRTSPGRAIVAIGGNEEAVRLAGINVRGNVFLAYALSGFFAGLAGVILASRLGISQPSVGAGFELDAIASCVIGGAILGGGGGSVFGTLAGVFSLGMIDNLMNLFNVQSYFQQIVKGAIILIAVLVRRKQR
jgi:ribose transport system permease protein